MVLVFDLDNTLIDRNKAYYLWLQEVLGDKNLSEGGWQKIYAKDDWGYCSRDIFYAWLRDAFQLKKDPSFFMDTCASELHQFLVKDPLLLDLLSRLGLNHEIVIATNGGVLNQTNKLKASGILEIVKAENIFISGNQKTKKPERKFFEGIENKFPTQSAFLMIGDDPINDIQGAKNLNWKTVWLSHRRNQKLNTDYVIPDIFALEKLLNEGSRI